MNKTEHMITKEQAISLRYGDEIHYTGNGQCERIVGPRGGVKETITRCRVSGMCKTWKTRPEEFRLPVKHGLYDNGAIDHLNQEHWHIAKDCPLCNS